MALSHMERLLLPSAKSSLCNRRSKPMAPAAATYLVDPGGLQDASGRVVIILMQTLQSTHHFAD